jgi:hypothetical protein
MIGPATHVIAGTGNPKMCGFPGRAGELGPFQIAGLMPLSAGLQDERTNSRTDSHCFSYLDLNQALGARYGRILEPG